MLLDIQKLFSHSFVVDLPSVLSIMVGGFYVKLYRACYHKISSVHIFILVSNLLYIPCSGLCGNFNDVLNDDPPRVG